MVQHAALGEEANCDGIKKEAGAPGTLATPAS
jgi:hypothetical protein